ncbi:hypothetical protein V2S66_17145 [Streptomyces sp. V4-01]|uniref:DNA primase n=1 Tax=Actinacidiphila polyblastidii TaxID=3110430 RepID=A0ABU7PD18_9ACTN|nr:hypothetical protein [Streptomyces sp. V4-01]
MEPVDTRRADLAARAYASVLGWPLVVGYRHRPRQGCTCGDPTCPTPGAHPAPGPLRYPGPTEFARQLEDAPGAALIAPTVYFDALIVSKRIGMSLMVELDHIAPVPCLFDGGRAVLLLLPATGRYALSPRMPAEVRSGPDQWIALPPSHGVHWDTHPWVDRTTSPVELLHGRDVSWHLDYAYKCELEEARK